MIFQFFLTNIGGSKVILGYPWICAIQPHIDWKQGWIDSEHLPIVFHAPEIYQRPFIPQDTSQDMQVADNSELSGLPSNYQHQLEEGDRLLIAHMAVETKDDPIDKISLPY